MNFYDLEIRKASGQTLKMSDFKNKTILIVNTATKCGLAPQFDELEELHQILIEMAEVDYFPNQYS